MNKAVRLEPLADYAGKVETEAARRLAASAKALTIKEKEVEQLRGYLAEYRQRAELDERTTDAAALAEHARVPGEAQRSRGRARSGAREGRRSAIDSRRRRWRDSHRRAKSLDKIVADAQREARNEVAKREQRELDERTLRRMLERTLACVA